MHFALLIIPIFLSFSALSMKRVFQPVSLASLSHPTFCLSKKTNPKCMQYTYPDKYNQTKPVETMKKMHFIYFYLSFMFILALYIFVEAIYQHYDNDSVVTFCDLMSGTDRQSNVTMNYSSSYIAIFCTKQTNTQIMCCGR
jgi:hypothetical protein